MSKIDLREGVLWRNWKGHREMGPRGGFTGSWYPKQSPTKDNFGIILPGKSRDANTT